MKKILFVLLAVLLILSIFATGCQVTRQVTRYEKYLAPIHDINLWADESLLPRYSLYVVSGEPSGCDHFDSYNVTRDGNTIRVEVFNLRFLGGVCACVYSYVEHTIPLGRCFIPGMTYTVVVNNVTETFVAQ